MPYSKPASELTLLTHTERMEILESLLTAADAIQVTAERITNNDPSVTLLNLQSDFAAFAYGFEYLRDATLHKRVAAGLTNNPES